MKLKPERETLITLGVILALTLVVFVVIRIVRVLL